MKFSPQTQTVLKNFASINPSIKFNEGKELRTMSPQKNIFAIAKIDEELANPFCIYDLNEFLAALSLFEDPELEIGERSATIKSGRNQIRYGFADESLIVKPPEGDIKFAEATGVSFTLPEEELVQAIRVAGIMSLPYLCIRGSEGKLILEVLDTNSSAGGSNDVSNVYSYELGDTDVECKVFFSIDNLKLIKDTYEVAVSPQKLAKFTGSTVNYYIAAESFSEF